MENNFEYDPIILQSMIGGLSALDIPRLKIQNLDEAKDFIKTYGYDLTIEEQRNQVWSYHRRAVTFMREELLEDGEEIPEILTDPNQLKEISYLLIYASTLDARTNTLQSWSCAILKVMHVLVHLGNDLFTLFSSDIQDQILRPLQSFIQSDPATGLRLINTATAESVDLKRFDVKPFKTSYSSVLKLLAKPEEVAFRILDKLGVRIVTKSLFDSFQVLRFLTQNHLISYAHGIPNESNNTLYPLNIFLEVMEGFTKEQKLSSKQIDEVLLQRLDNAFDRAQYREKVNTFTSKDYRFIKFINRQLVRVEIGSSDVTKTLRFFYPFEIQIVDYETYLKNLSGPASHEKYKLRQKQRARRRILGVDNEKLKDND